MRDLFLDNLFRRYFVVGAIICFTQTVTLLLQTSLAGLMLSAAAANSLTNTILLFMLIYGVSLCFGRTISIRISKEIGAFNTEKVNFLYTQGLILSLLLGIVLFVASLLLVEPIAYIFSSDDLSYGYAHQYLRTIVFAAPALPVLTLYTELTFMNGKFKKCLIVTIIYNVLYIVVSAIFAMRGFELTGISLGLIVVCYATIIVLYIRETPPEEKREIRKLKLVFNRDMKDIVLDSLVYAATYFFDTFLSLFTFIWISSYFGGEYNAVFDAVYLCESLAYLIIESFITVMNPVVSTYLGEGNDAFAYSFIKKCLKACLAIGIATTVIYLVMGSSIATMVRPSNALIYDYSLYAVILFAITSTFLLTQGIYLQLLIIVGKRRTAFKVLLLKILAACGLCIIFSLVFGFSGLYVGYVAIPIVTIAIIKRVNKRLIPVDKDRYQTANYGICLDRASIDALIANLEGDVRASVESYLNSIAAQAGKEAYAQVSIIRTQDKVKVYIRNTRMPESKNSPEEGFMPANSYDRARFILNEEY